MNLNTKRARKKEIKITTYEELCLHPLPWGSLGMSASFSDQPFTPHGNSPHLPAQNTGLLTLSGAVKQTIDQVVLKKANSWYWSPSLLHSLIVHLTALFLIVVRSGFLSTACMFVRWGILGTSLYSNVEKFSCHFA